MHHLHGKSAKVMGKEKGGIERQEKINLNLVIRNVLALATMEEKMPWH